MFVSHLLCTVEFYGLRPAPPGSFGDDIVVEGWFLSHDAVAGMMLVFPGQATFVIEDRCRPSEEVWIHHGGTFGEKARAARFLLVEPSANEPLDLVKARLRIELVGHASYEAPIGHILQRSEDKNFTQEDHDLVMSFESLGDNCEFGLLQRFIGSERLGLLRYAGVGNIDDLARAIASGFAALGTHDDITITKRGREWIAKASGSSLTFHTSRGGESITHDRVLAEEIRTLIFLAGKLIDDLAMAKKIFVYRSLADDKGGSDGTRGMRALHEAMRSHGAARLLWVNEADQTHPHGSIYHLGEGLYRGFIDHLAPPWNAFDFRPYSWLQLLRAARTTMSPDSPQPEASDGHSPRPSGTLSSQ